jgi:hypothetical protein
MAMMVDSMEYITDTVSRGVSCLTCWSEDRQVAESLASLINMGYPCEVDVEMSWRSSSWDWQSSP